jgi:outer membrane protein OmpA-like peptidoglycan-associated protein
MSSQDNDPDIRVVAVVLVAAILLAMGLAVGMGLSQVRSAGAPASSMVTAPAVASGAAAVLLVSDDASVVVESGVVKFYFASGKADLASGALGALRDSVAAAQAGKELVISGFHDATGDPAFNAELAKQRAMAVRNILVGAGVVDASIELKKPEQTTGSGNDAEARRVEVMIANGSASR